MPSEEDPQLRERTMAIEERRIAIEEMRVAIEKRRVAIEKERENRLKAERERELSLAERQAEPKHWTEAFGNPFVVAAVAGILALAANGLVAFVNNRGELDLAARKEQSDLVLIALGSDDVEKVKENLKLLAEAKLITSDDQRNSILQYLDTLEEGQGPGGLGQTAPAARPITDSASGGLALSLANVFSNYRRDITYQRAIEEGRIPVAVVGDSWLNYPFMLRDISDHLSADFAVFSRANAGDCIKSMLVRERDLPPEVEFVLVSAGLCELFGDDGVVSTVVPPAEGDSPFGSAADRKFGAIRAQLEIMIDGLMLEVPHAQLALHGYDYLPPIVPSKPLGSRFAARGYEGPAANELSRQIIDEFSDIAATLAAERPRLTFIDLRGTLGPREWFDELHPTNAGFTKISDTIRTRILEPTGATSE